jgi:hypothetical protein
MVYSAIKNVVIFDRTTSDYLILPNIAKVIISEIYNSYNDIEDNYINLDNRADISIISYETTKEIIDILRTYNGISKDVLIIGIDNKQILIEDLFLVFEISRKYPKVHELIIRAKKNHDNLIAVPDEDLLGGIGDFEKHNNIVGDGWGLSGNITASIQDSQDGSRAQDVEFITPNESKFYSLKERCLLNSGDKLTLSGISYSFTINPIYQPIDLRLYNDYLGTEETIAVSYQSTEDVWVDFSLPITVSGLFTGFSVQFHNAPPTSNYHLKFDKIKLIRG